MTVLEKINKLTDKKDGLGISMTILGKYLGCSPNSIIYYLKGKEPKEAVIERYESGLNQLLEDFKKIIEG